VKVPAWSRAEKAHVVLGILVCAVVPGVSYLDGSGRLAYRMFAEVRDYRLEVRANDGHGGSRLVPSGELARATGGSTSQFFGGIDHFRRGTVALMPRALLGDIAALACSVTGAATVDVRWEERKDRDAPITETTTHRACAGE
jgi:hypothetical protein